LLLIKVNQTIRILNTKDIIIIVTWHVQNASTS
jgi:hypothetical protein